MTSNKKLNIFNLDFAVFYSLQPTPWLRVNIVINLYGRVYFADPKSNLFYQRQRFCRQLEFKLKLSEVKKQQFY